MAEKKSAKYPYRWSDGTYHSRPQHTSVVRPSGSGLPAGTPASGLPAGSPAQVGFTAPQAQAQQPDPAFEQAKAQATRQRSVADLQSGYELGRIGQEYGIGDSSNPYSRANLLMQNFQRGQAGTNVGYAGQGQLYSGAYQTAQAEQQNQYNIGYDQLSRAYQDAVAQVQLGRLGTYAEYGTGQDDAAFQSLLAGFRR